jgi:hypothetical protein
MPSTTASSFFSRYIAQQYSNTISNYYPVIAERYYYALDLTDNDFYTLQNSLPLEGSTVLQGALLYYNTSTLDAYAMIFYYSVNTDPTGYSFNAAFFKASNWPSDFDPTQYVNQCRPLTVPPGVVFATTPEFYETNATIPTCYTLRFRSYPNMNSFVFNYNGNQQTVQSRVGTFLANASSYLNQTLSTSTSVQRWTAINAQYIQQLSSPIAGTRTTKARLEENESDDVMRH